MEYRNIFIANPAKLSVQMEQLVIEQAEKYTVPIEDLSAVLIESQQVQLTANTIESLAEKGVTVYFCDKKHLPACQILPVNQYCRQRKQLLKQCELSKPLQKQIWQSIVIQKIRNQAKCLTLSHKDGSAMLQTMAADVLSNDSDNREAVAAATYFPLLFGAEFSRGSDDIRNAALNYGYAIIRGCIARIL
jgi:CRISPR-associated protein Cas1